MDYSNRTSLEKTLRRTNIKRFSKSNRMRTGKDSLGANREGIIGVRGAVFIRIAVIGRRIMSTNNSLLRTLRMVMGRAF